MCESKVLLSSSYVVNLMIFFSCYFSSTLKIFIALLVLSHYKVISKGGKIWHILFGNGTTVKIPCEIKPPFFALST